MSLLSNSRFTAGVTALLLASADHVVQKQMLIRNTDAVLSVFLGDSSVTTSNGFELLPGEALSFGLGYSEQDIQVIYVVAAGSVVIDVLVRMSA